MAATGTTVTWLGRRRRVERLPISPISLGRWSTSWYAAVGKDLRRRRPAPRGDAGPAGGGVHGVWSQGRTDGQAQAVQEPAVDRGVQRVLVPARSGEGGAGLVIAGEVLAGQ